jgi:pyruvate/2-oxoglutarate dehydrogenase complex dihydrolipoamide acyltransferase (E2) component
MARVPIEMPSAGYDMERGRIIGWLKRPGDRVERGEAIAEIETEKTTVELEALTAGTLVEIVHDVGADVAVGEPVGWLEDDAS